MKNGSNKKKLIVAGCIMFLLLAAFWGPNMPHLINADKPFIDLSGSIGESIGNANTAYEKAVLTPAPTDAPEITTTPAPTDVPDVTDVEGSKIRISVGDDEYTGSGETVYIKGMMTDSVEVKVSSVDSLKEMLSTGRFDDVEIILVDNYAETKTFKNVKLALDEFGKTYSVEHVG